VKASLLWCSYRLTVFGFMGSEELRRENGLENGGNYSKGWASKLLRTTS